MHTTTVSTRGALRHWVIGCLLLVIVIVGLFVGAGYWAFKKVAPGPFSVATKADPPVGAMPDALFPEKVGDYTLNNLTTPSPAQGDMASTGTKAIYVDATGTKNVNIIAIPTNEMSNAQVSAGRSRTQTTTGNTTETVEVQMPNFGTQMKSGPSDTGFSMKMPWGPMKMEMAFWSKPNWSYFVQTTNSVALDFAQKFEPPSSSQSGREATPATEGTQVSQ